MKLKDGVTFLGARPCNPMLWMISQDTRVEGHRVVTLHCRKKESGYAQRSVVSLHRWKYRLRVSFSDQKVNLGVKLWSRYEMPLRDICINLYGKVELIQNRFCFFFPISKPVKVGKRGSERTGACKSDPKRNTSVVFYFC